MIMRIIPTFDRRRNTGEASLWSACYEEDKENGRYVDVFTILFRKWNDIEYLNEFFDANKSDLNNPFWKNISKEEAINKVLDEAADFEDELMAIEYRKKGYEKSSISSLFVSFHKNEFLIKPKESREANFRKGKPDAKVPMLRLYGIELEDKCIVITGGAIKLTKQLNEETRKNQLNNLRKVHEYLKSENIYSKEDFEL